MIPYFSACMDTFTYLITQLVTTKLSQQFLWKPWWMEARNLVRSGYKKNHVLWLRISPLPLSAGGPAPDLGFSEIWKDKFTGNVKRLHSPSLQVSGWGCNTPSGCDNIATGLAPTPVSKWYITLTGPCCSADKEWHLPSRPQAKLIFKWHPGEMQGYYFRARVELRKTRMSLSLLASVIVQGFQADAESVTLGLRYCCD